MIITDLQFLRMKSNPISNVFEARKLLETLEEILKETGGIGISAIQIGIPKQIAIVKNNIVLINPIILEQEDEFIHTNEGCLSLPKQYFNVKRFEQIIIENQVIDGTEFRTQKEVYYYDKETNSKDLTCIAVQHEIDHMAGITLKDKGILCNLISKVGRNDPCPCGSGKKYKKCHGG